MKNTQFILVRGETKRSKGISGMEIESQSWFQPDYMLESSEQLLKLSVPKLQPRSATQTNCIKPESRIQTSVFFTEKTVPRNRNFNWMWNKRTIELFIYSGNSLTFCLQIMCWSPTMCLEHPGLETGNQHLRTQEWKSTEFYLKEHKSMGEIDAHIQRQRSTPEAQLGNLGKGGSNRYIFREMTAQKELTFNLS